MATKRCPTCKETKPADDFNQNPSHRDGLSTQCKLCRRALERDSYRRRKGLPPPPPPPPAWVDSPPAICASCDEGEHDTCLNMLHAGVCACTCPEDGNLVQPPQSISTFLVCGLDVERKIVRAPAPWPPARHCVSGHLIDGTNAYYSAAEDKWLCHRCRKAQWKRAAKRRHAAMMSAAARPSLEP